MKTLTITRRSVALNHQQRALLNALCGGGQTNAMRAAVEYLNLRKLVWGDCKRIAGKFNVTSRAISDQLRRWGCKPRLRKGAL